MGELHTSATTMVTVVPDDGDSFEVVASVPPDGIYDPSPHLPDGATIRVADSSRNVRVGWQVKYGADVHAIMAVEPDIGPDGEPDPSALLLELRRSER